MLFHFLNFSQCVVCMLGDKTIYKVTHLEVHSKERYIVFIVSSLRHTCAIIMLSNQHLDMPHL